MHSVRNDPSALGFLFCTSLLKRACDFFFSLCLIDTHTFMSTPPSTILTTLRGVSIVVACITGSFPPFLTLEWMRGEREGCNSADCFAVQLSRDRKMCCCARAGRADLAVSLSDFFPVRDSAVFVSLKILSHSCYSFLGKKQQHTNGARLCMFRVRGGYLLAFFLFICYSFAKPHNAIFSFYFRHLPNFLATPPTTSQP
jgi:hypothetical protein